MGIFTSNKVSELILDNMKVGVV